MIKNIQKRATDFAIRKVRKINKAAERKRREQQLERMSQKVYAQVTKDIENATRQIQEDMKNITAESRRIQKEIQQEMDETFRKYYDEIR